MEFEYLTFEKFPAALEDKIKNVSKAIILLVRLREFQNCRFLFNKNFITQLMTVTA